MTTVIIEVKVMAQNTRTAEFVLGLLGGIFGVLASIGALFIGGLGAALGAQGAGQVGGLSIGALIFSALGIVGCVLVRTKAKVGGLLMTVAAIGGIICISAFYIIPGALLIIAGLMGLIRKTNPGT